MDRRWTFSTAERRRFEKLHPDLLFGREEGEIASSGHVIDTLEAALWVNARHGDYAATVLHAVNLGDDTDTTGCVAGALAGIIHGIAGIPAEWRETLVKGDILEQAATEFAGFAPRKK
jgi:ADP-ribosylglycohydrolase